MSAGPAATRPITVTIAALGGQGGGVVSDWLIDVARRSGYLAQATSVPGVAQRTGATIYYLEFFPVAAFAGRRAPAHLCADAESRRCGRGDRLGNHGSRPRDAARAGDRPHHAHRLFASNLRHPREISHGRRPRRFRTRCVRWRGSTRSGISSSTCRRWRRPTAASSAPPCSAQSAVPGRCLSPRNTMWKRFGRAASKPRRAPGPSRPRGARRQAPRRRRRLAALRGADSPPRGGRVGAQHRWRAPLRVPRFLRPWMSEFARRVPAAAQDIAREGVRRMIDYQDVAYAVLYLDRLDAVAALEPKGSESFALTAAVARGLALWMSFEDTIRVADLKIRAARAKRVLQEVRPSPGQLVQVTEFMKPRVEEICGTLPAGLGSVDSAFEGAEALDDPSSRAAGRSRLPASAGSCSSTGSPDCAAGAARLCATRKSTCASSAGWN